jgi:hypothetical protein
MWSLVEERKRFRRRQQAIGLDSTKVVGLPRVMAVLSVKYFPYQSQDVILP